MNEPFFALLLSLTINFAQKAVMDCFQPRFITFWTEKIKLVEVGKKSLQVAQVAFLFNYLSAFGTSVVHDRWYFLRTLDLFFL